MDIEVGKTYGKLTIVRRWNFKWRKSPYAGQPAFLCVCECTDQVTLPQGAIEGSAVRVQACGECQPTYRTPRVPQSLVNPAGHKVVDELQAEGLPPMRAYFEYLRRTHVEPVPTPAQLRALRRLSEPDLGLSVPPATLRVLEAHKWVQAGELTDKGRGLIAQG